jgi:hypothetical protein
MTWSCWWNLEQCLSQLQFKTLLHSTLLADFADQDTFEESSVDANKLTLAGKTGLSVAL